MKSSTVCTKFLNEEGLKVTEGAQTLHRPRGGRQHAGCPIAPRAGVGLCADWDEREETAVDEGVLQRFLGPRSERFYMTSRMR